MARILAVTTPWGHVEFADSNRRNKIDVITGPNGSGKTACLTAVAEVFARRATNSGLVRWRTTGGQEVESPRSPYRPDRVVVQTFSPFSRFARPSPLPSSIAGPYLGGGDSQDVYRSVGLHRGLASIGGGLSRNIVEKGLYQLSESPQHARSMRSVLRQLGFRPRVTVQFRTNSVLSHLLRIHDQGLLRPYLEDLQGGTASVPTSHSRVQNALSIEINSFGIDPLVELLAVSLGLVRKGTVGKRIEFTFDLERGTEDYAVLQALAFARRIFLLERTKFFLHRGERDIVDISNASSGEQQLVCSIFGLASSMRDGAVLLIDEPELSLHPNWQLNYLARLEELLEHYTDCHVLVATHSPLIVQAALAAGVPVLSVSRGGGSALSDQRLYNEKVSLDEALFQVFRTPLPSSRYLGDLLFKIVADAKTDDETNEVAARARLSDLRSLYAPSDDQDAIRLIALAERAVRRNG